MIYIRHDEGSYKQTRGYFYKVPVKIEAWQLDDQNGGAIAEWCGGVLRGGPDGGSKSGHIIIDTLEGRMTASLGDWIIRGVRGEFYPCKPDIFAETYQPVSPHQPPISLVPMGPRCDVCGTPASTWVGVGEGDPCLCGGTMASRLVAAAETTPDDGTVWSEPRQDFPGGPVYRWGFSAGASPAAASPVVEDASTEDEAPKDAALAGDTDQSGDSVGQPRVAGAELSAVGASERLAAIRARVDGLGNRLATWEFAGTPWKTREANELLAEVSWILNSLLDRGVLSPHDGAAPVFQPEPAPANDLWQKIQDQRAANDKLQRKYNTIKGQLGAMEAACERAVMRENARFVAAEADADRLREALRELLAAAEAECGPKSPGSEDKTAEYWAAMNPAPDKNAGGVTRRIILARAVLRARQVLAEDTQLPAAPVSHGDKRGSAVPGSRPG